ncbi:glycogen/starch/alpha-glucan phosphorylase [Lagierella sp.]|uniref:glycogen/starch/alpha-glucan phosphorylase n=1 Tax=Lagierella sp. TaxID=2849657 RepID=UPI00262A5E9B|nr:glycogen/starch/alpha-glucan phosphorylase [Lagierella sp.]
MNKISKEELADRIKYELHNRKALTFYEIKPFDIYLAVVKCLRDILASSWTKSKERIFAKQSKAQEKGSLIDNGSLDQKQEFFNSQRQIYLFSFEFLTGKFLNRTLNYTGLRETLKDSLELLGYDFDEIMNMDILPFLGEGSLGELSFSILESGTCENLNIKGYCLRYENGRFKQEIVHGSQIEKTINWISKGFPWEVKRSGRQTIQIANTNLEAVSYDIPIIGYECEAVNTLRLFQARGDSLLNPMNVIDNKNSDKSLNYILVKALSSFMYMEDVNSQGKKIRLAQEYFLATSGVKDIIEDLKLRGIEDGFEDRIKILLNEHHTLITIPVFMKEFCEVFEISKEDCIELIPKIFQYRSFEDIMGRPKIWSKELIVDICPDLVEYLDYIVRRMDLEVENSKKDSNDYGFDSSYNLTEIMIYLVKEIRFLSQMQEHSLIQDYKKIHNEGFNKKFRVDKSLLNLSTWMGEANPRLLDYLNKKLDTDILKNSKGLSRLSSLINEEMINDIYKIKRDNKLRIKELVFKKYHRSINPESMYIMNLRTFQERRRQFLTCLYLTEKYFELMDNANMDMVDRTYFIGGISSQKYLASKYVIKYINQLMEIINRDISIKDKIKVIFVENLNKEKMLNLVSGCDIVEQISTPGLEVVGSNPLMYMASGSLVMGSKTGLNLDIRNMIAEENIFLFGRSKEEVDYDFAHNFYNPERFISENSRLKNLIYRIRMSTFPDLKESFESLYHIIIKYNDSFQVFRDYDSYYDTWEKIAKQFRDKDNWTKKSIINIGACGNFSHPLEID